MTPDIEAILQSNGFTFISILQESKSKKVVLAFNKEKKKIVIKSFKETNRFIEREISFLKSFSEHKFSYLVFPKLISREHNFFLTEFVERKYYTRDSIAAMDWTDQNYISFISGLTEFQSIKREKKYFTKAEILKGFFFPAFIIFKNYWRVRREFSISEKVKILQAAFYYLFASIFNKKVSAHYDLQTTNFTFIEGSEKMSMLDMETGPYNGDEWYDIAYYCSIPVVKLEDWTFQRNLFASFLKILAKKKSQKTFKSRLRAILIATQLIRYVNFRNDVGKREVYFHNLREVLLKRKNFDSWFHSVMGKETP